MNAAAAVCAALLAGMLFLATAEAQLPIERSFIVDVKLLDAYFGTSEEKIEVSPGDENVPFTLMLVNVGSEDITAIRGSISLPLGFHSSDGTDGAIMAESEKNSRTGELFYLTFFIGLDESLEIGRYPGTADVAYSRILESGTRNSVFQFDFRVTGESDIDVRTGSPFLTSRQNNEITIEISNDGTTAISGVDIRIVNTESAMQSPTNMENVIITETRWDAGNIGPGDAMHLNSSIYVPDSVRGETLRLPLEISYFNAYGDRITTIRVVDFFVSQVTGESSIEIVTGSPFLTSLRNNEISIAISNGGTTAISEVDVRIENTESEVSPLTNIESVIIVETRWDVVDIGPGDTRYLDSTVYVPDSARGETLRLPLEIDYFNTYGDRITTTKVMDFYVKGMLDTRIYDVNLIDLSGKPTVIGSIINEGNEDALFAFVTIRPLGNSTVMEATQFIDEIQVDSPIPFNIPVEFDGAPQYGEHEVEITVRYKDSVREEYFVSQQAVVTIPEPAVEEQDILADGSLAAVVVVIGAGAAGAWLFARRRRKAEPED